jgi:maltooligosyltrehalose trehalohydrolase
LVDQCHAQGIAVVLDVVYNHFGPEGCYFHKIGPYFTNNYKTPWGSAINFDDAWCDGVRNFFIENTLMWFRDFHIDALRYDAVHAIKDLSAVHLMREIRTNVDALIRQTWSMHYMIAELDLNDTRYIRSLKKGGYGMDAQWVDEFHHALRVTAGQEQTGYYEDFNGVSHLAKSYQGAYVYDGQYSHHRRRRFGVKTDDHEGNQFVVFSQNHDHVGNRMHGERSCHLYSFEMTKLLAGATLVSPFIPMLFMGEEYGEKNPFLYFVSHSDEELIENIRQGRKREFAAFHAGENLYDPQSETTFLASKLQWELIHADQHQYLLAFYKNLIQTRKELPALRHLNRKQLEVQFDERSKTLTLHRWHHDHHVLCLMNFSKKTAQIPVIPGKHWLLSLDSSSYLWGGPSALSYEQPDENNLVHVAPESILMLSSHYV